MSTELVKRENTPIGPTEHFSAQQKAILKEMFFKDSTDDEFYMFLYSCQRTGLDPFVKQIHPVKRWNSDLQKNTMTIQIGVDGYRMVADKTGRYAPGRAPTYEYDKAGNLFSATAYVKKQTEDGTWHEVPATALYKEYVQLTKQGIPTKIWKERDHGQLAKCAECLALRKAFPWHFSGTHGAEEMEQADNIEIVNNRVSKAQVNALEAIFKECDPKYVENVKKHAKSEFEIEYFSDLTQEQYDRILMSAKNNQALCREKREEELAKLKKEADADLKAGKEEMELFGVTA